MTHVPASPLSTFAERGCFLSLMMLLLFLHVLLLVLSA